MPRLELIVKPLGQPPRTVPLDRALVVGRSRRADLTIDDEEVGREQFRIDVDDGGLSLEAIGKTNQTLVDDTVVEPGMRRPLFVGTTIRTGRTTFVVHSNETTDAAPPPGSAGPEMTVVARGPIARGPRADVKPPQPPQPPAQPEPPQEQPPLGTIAAPRPGGAPAGESLDQTMQWGGAYRPGYRPGQPPPPTPPDRTAPAAPAPEPPKPPRAASPSLPPAPAKPASPLGNVRPSTVAIPPADIAAEIGQAEPARAGGGDHEARVHEALPRVFVKCDGMKRRIRLMKARNALGRAESTDVLLPNESVSELHAEITFDGTTWMLRDRGSTNGTFVDGTQLRGDSQPILRHSLIGLGVVRAIFLCNTPGQQVAERRLEERAAKLLVQAKRLSGEASREAQRIVRADPGQSMAEVLLMDTPLSPAEWATAVSTARGQRSMVDALRDLLARLMPKKRPAR